MVPPLHRRLNAISIASVKQNVLHLIPSFHQGGSERQALQLARLLFDDGTYHVRLACLDRNGILLDKSVTERFDEIPEFPLTSFYNVNMARQLRRFVSWLRANKIDLIQTHDFYTNIFGMAGARIAGVAVRIAAKRETGMRTRAQQLIERRAFGLADLVVVNSNRVREYLDSSGVPARKLEVVYNGIDDGRFAPSNGDRSSLLRDLGLPCDEKLRFVTIVANMRESVKNHEMFLRAARTVRQNFPDAAFIIAGEGERMRLITSMAGDLGLQDRMFFLGRCTRIPELLALSDICVLTSDSEGFSNSILEYMAAGRPVVATSVGGAAEAIVENETGFLVAPNDDSALAERICRLFNDRTLLEEFGRKGKQRAMERFSVEGQLAGTLEIYQRELGRINA